MPVKIIKTVLKNPLISGSTILFVGGFIANVINYLFNLLMGRFLSVPDYGLISSLSSLFILTAFFSVAFGNVVTKYIAQYHGTKNKIGESEVLKTGSKYVAIFSLLFLFVFLLLTPAISNLLHVEDSTFVIFIAFSSFFSLLLSLPQGFIQGKLWFTFFAFVAIIQPVIKLIVAVTLIYLGYSLLGPFTGILLSSAIPAILLYFYLFRRYKNDEANQSLNDGVFKKDFIHSSFTFFLSGVGFTVLQNTDIILVRHFFGPYESGLYAALSMMGKAIFYFTSPINAVFFPLIAYKKEKKERLFHIVALASGLIASLSAGISFIYFVFPNLVIKIFFPSASYQEIAQYLGIFSLYILVLSLVSLFNNFYLSIGKTGVYKVTLVAAVLQVVLIMLFHQSLYQVIGILFANSFIVLILFLLYYMRHGKD